MNFNSATKMKSSCKCKAHLLFEEVPLLQSQGVSLGDNRNNIHHFTETSHELYIQRPKTEDKGEIDVMDCTGLHINHQRAKTTQNIHALRCDTHSKNAWAWKDYSRNVFTDV